MSVGDALLYLLIGIIIVGSFSLVSGGPQFNLSTSTNEPAGDIVMETPTQKQDSLQMNTIKFQACESQLNIDLLLDRSNSMEQDTKTPGVSKIDALKIAVKALVKDINDDSLIGIQSFDSSSITNDVPIGPYKDSKARIPGIIDAITPNGSTPTHNALAFSYSKLQEAKVKYPGKKISFIFITDGQPQPISQDPRLFNPNPATQIKALGYPIYTIGIGSRGFSDLLRDIASTPANYYDSPTGNDLTKLLSEIKEKICRGNNPAPVITPVPLTPAPTATPTQTPTPTPTPSGPTPTFTPVPTLPPSTNSTN